MAYNMQYSTMPAQHLFRGNMTNSHFYSQEDIDFPLTWQNIDPALRDPQTPTSMSWQEQQPLQRWVEEPEKPLFTAGFIQNFTAHNSNSSFGPTSSLPQAVRTRMDSPTPSHEPSSTCSSARSPKAEAEYYSDSHYSPHSQEDYSMQNSFSYLHQGLPDWRDQPQSYVFPQAAGNPCVNLSQVQAFEDLQEATFEAADEGYMDMETKMDYIEVDTHHVKSESNHAHYHQSSDEGLGTSIKDEGSPQNQSSPQEDQDADAEADEDNIVVTSEYPDPEADSDTEYNPRSSNRTRKRSSRTIKPTSPTNKRNQTHRITKNHSKSNNKSSSGLVCKSCPNLPPFRDANALQRHTTSAHTRPFVCVFHFAGCHSTFASKNEWKRHVSSQHLNLSYWSCKQGSCSKNNNGSGSEFNRKDLFTQHLRRMHAPFAVKRQGKKVLEWEERVRELHGTAMRERRKPPVLLKCPVEDCNVPFEGSAAWDERMEHVGKHLEKGMSVRQGDDELLVGWAEHEGVVERKGNRWRFCGGAPASGKAGLVDDVDAEGEDE